MQGTNVSAGRLGSDGGGPGPPVDIIYKNCRYGCQGKSGDGISGCRPCGNKWHIDSSHCYKHCCVDAFTPAASKYCYPMGSDDHHPIDPPHLTEERLIKVKQ